MANEISILGLSCVKIVRLSGSSNRMEMKFNRPGFQSVMVTPQKEEYCFFFVLLLIKDKKEDLR